MLGSKKAIILGGAGWWFPGSSIDLNFQTNQAAVYSQNAGLATSQLSITRATVGMAQNLSGLWRPFAVSDFRITDKGLLVEEARTNDALWSRDMTNAAWVKVNMTVALTATGIDGTANAASNLTATAGNATVLQTITLGSTADTYDVFLQRVSGTGNVQITVDNGVTWTTQSITTTWTQFQVQKTAANPIFGIRIVTNGDVINADFSQLEPGGFATSPIFTTNAAVTRNADLVQVVGAGATSIPLSASAFFQTFGVGGIGAGANRLLAMNNAQLQMPSLTQVQAADGTNVALAVLGSGTFASAAQIAFGLDNTSMTVVVNGGAKVTQATSTWATQAAGQTPYLGNTSSANRASNGYLQRAAFAIPKGLFDNRTSP